MEIKDIVEFLKKYDGRELTFMEVCGTHTASISENGIPEIISDKIRLVSGPGCPVCVTTSEYIDRLVSLACEEKTCVVTFGDMIRVRGSKKSLRDTGAEGGRVQMVYSPLEIIALAENEPETIFIFAAVGFETTTPVYAILIQEVINKNLKNVKLLTALKTMPQAIRTVYGNGEIVDGFIAPGHVSVITGSREFEPLAKELKVPFAIAGFEGEELLAAIYSLVKSDKKDIVINLYKTYVTEEGNVAAKELVSKYFEPCDAAWRGMGIIPGSGMCLKEEYAQYDAGSRGLTGDNIYNKKCSCGSVVAGVKSPTECELFGGGCTPANPQGACMVSTEGACYHYYTNRRK